jgi:hypothetical protein
MHVRQLSIHRAVNQNTGSSPRTTWLYTNGHDTIRLSVVEHAPAVFKLVIAGPGHRRKSIEFSDALSLVQYQGTIEAALLTQGYGLEDFAAERSGAREAIAAPSLAAATASVESSTRLKSFPN